MKDNKDTENVENKENEINKENKEKKIEVVIGDGKNLNISPAYDHIDIEKPKEEKEKKDIVIPKEKKQ